MQMLLPLKTMTYNHGPNKGNEIMTEATKRQGEISNLHPVPATASREEELSSKLAELTKEMNQFTYIVSHDLQAPLRTVTGFLELLVKRYGDKLDDSAKQYIEYAVKGAAKMKDLVFDLLEYSRLNNALNFAEVDLNAALEESKEKLSAAIEESRAVIRADKLPVITGDKKQIVQMLAHLLQNAIMFRSTAAPEIDVIVEEEKGKLKIGVKDNGIGIDAAYHEKIFIIFRRLHTDEAKYPGTGTGLAVCKKIAALHGGTIWVESVIGKGSTFWVTLPAKQEINL